jgi:hypothetical protein
VGLIYNFPAELLAPVSIYQAEAQLAISSKTVHPGEEFVLPLTISNASNVYAMQVELSYDPFYLKAIEVENMIPEMNFSYSINEQDGTIVIAFAGIQPIEGNTAIANLKLKAIQEAGPEVETEISASFFMANETDQSANTHSGTVTINGLATGTTPYSGDNGSNLKCYPNPFSDIINIEYAISENGSNVFIGVYDLTGRLIAEIVNGKHAAEFYQIPWNGTDKTGQLLNNGIYFLKLQSGNKSEIQKIQIVR